MTTVNQINVTTKDSVAFGGIESTFGAAATTAAIFPIVESFEPTLSQEEIENNDPSALLMDYQAPVLGLKAGGCKFGCYVRANAQVTSAVGATPWLGTLLKGVLGNETKGDGTTATTGAIAGTNVTVTSASGFTIGQIIGLEVSGSIEPCVVTNKVGSVLSLWPSTTGNVAVTSGVVANGYNYWLTSTNTQSLTVEHAYASNANEQYRFLGCTGDVQIATPNGKMLQADFDLKAADWSQGALSLTRTVQSNGMTGIFGNTGQVVLMQPAATLTRVQYMVDDFKLSLKGNNVHFPAHGGTQGRGGVMRVGGRDAVMVTMKMRADTDIRAIWTGRTVERLLYAVPQGSLTTKQWFVVYIPKAIMVGNPKPIKEGGRLLYEVTYRAQIDTTATADTITGSPIVIALI